jgi:hypothetical protein
MRSTYALQAFFAVSIFALTACSNGGNSQGPCNLNPFECSAGQTCWVSDNNTPPTFACLNSGPGKKGASCSPTIDAPRVAMDLFVFRAPAPAASV